MHTITLPKIGTFDAWRRSARQLAEAGVRPEDTVWSRGTAAPGLFDDAPLPTTASREVRVPKAFLPLARAVAAHQDPERFALLYTALVRCQGSSRLLADRTDPLIQRLKRMEKAVHRDQHKMKAFLRFREWHSGPRRAFVAWFEPTHFIMENMRDFFANRFAAMDFLIVTPDVSMRFENGAISFELDVPRPPDLDDTAEALWKTYFANIFNPARLKISAMQSEMPKKYWKNLPEAELIPGMIAMAQSREQMMRAAAPGPGHAAAEKWRMQPETMEDVQKGLAACARCPLAGPATQAVAGQGPASADLMIVGEQPGDQEDLTGQPFVGPAGQLFDRLAATAGLDRSAAFVTNAVKHFKFQQRGKRRIHQRPNQSEISHCRWWLDREIAVVQPRLILALGATATQALTGNGKELMARRGRLEDSQAGPPVLITLHPSYVLRHPDAGQRDAAERMLTRDLAAAAETLRSLSHQPVA